MELGRVAAEFQHVAEHGDAPPLAGDGRGVEQRHRRLHRGGVGVVALVDQRDRAASDGRARWRLPRPASGIRLGERQRHLVDVGADQVVQRRAPQARSARCGGRARRCGSDRPCRRSSPRSANDRRAARRWSAGRPPARSRRSRRSSRRPPRGPALPEDSSGHRRG